MKKNGVPALSNPSKTSDENLKSVYLQQNYMITEGLLKSGFKLKAADLFTRSMNSIVETLENEKSFRHYYHAEKKKGITGTNLLILLECRLDNVVYRMGFASSRKQARQLVRHNHFLVNNRKVNIPSFQVKVGDEVTVKEGSRKVQAILDAMETVVRRGIPNWIEIEKDSFRGTLKSIPNREDLTMPIQEQLIVELYSK